MFCAGLLLSIADLLECFDLTNESQDHSTFLTLPHENHGRTTCLSHSPLSQLCRLTGSCEYHTVSAVPFQPGSWQKDTFRSWCRRCVELLMSGGCVQSRRRQFA